VTVQTPKIVWVGHRGYPEIYPENSLLGIEVALKLGAGAIEIDLQASGDGEPVLFHDDELFRLTGNNGAVSDYTWEKLQGFSAHEPQRLGKQFYPTPIAHLRQVVDLMRQYPEAQLFVELKSEVFSQIPRLVFLTKVWQILQPIHASVVLISYDLYVLRLAQEHFACRVGWVLTRYDHQSHARIKNNPVDFVICNIRKIPELPEQPWPGRWEWFVYDVVEEEGVRACTARGIYWIETWNVGGMLAMEQQNP
jgi:glycerophosphoryl diester phosphodiesterase